MRLNIQELLSTPEGKIKLAKSMYTKAWPCPHCGKILRCELDEEEHVGSDECVVAEVMAR